MKKAIESPNLPKSNAILCAVGERYTQVTDALNSRGIEVLGLKEDERISSAVRSHADMLICHIKDDLVICGNEDNYNILKAEHLKPIYACKTPQPVYPSDVHLNHIILGKFAAGRRDACDKAVLTALGDLDIDYIDIHQGYAKCLTAVVNERAIITSDYSVTKAALSAGIDVLVIRTGHIDLEGYNYGFIGGTCGLIAPDRLAFAGDIYTHPDADKIMGFLGKYGVKTECLFDGTLQDIGGILPLMES